MSTDIHSEKILILDFGSQYTQLIARRVREAHVYCELHPFDMDPGNDTVLRSPPESYSPEGRNRLRFRSALCSRGAF